MGHLEKSEWPLDFIRDIGYHTDMTNITSVPRQGLLANIPTAEYNFQNPTAIALARIEYLQRIMTRGEVPVSYYTFSAIINTVPLLDKLINELIQRNGGTANLIARDVAITSPGATCAYEFTGGEYSFFMASDNDDGLIFITSYDNEQNKSFHKMLEEIVTPFYDDPDSESKIYVIEDNDYGLRIAPFGRPIGVDWTPSHYTEKCIDGFFEIIENIKSTKPEGKLIILQGDPGTGKTYFIRHLIAEITDEAYFVILPLDLLPGMNGSKFTRFISKNIQKWEKKTIVFIMEDAEIALMDRAGDNATMVSTMLNWTEGLTSASVNVRILASTNADFKNYDPALLRPGRLGISLKFEKLPAIRAKALLRELSPTITDSFVEENIGQFSRSLAEVYQMSSKWEKNK